VEQATEAPTPTASQPRTGTFDHAHTVAGAIVARLEQKPFAVEIEEDFPSGWRVHLKFRESRAAGLLDFAALVDVPVTRATTEFGIHLDAFARVDHVEVRGSAIVSPDTAAQLEGQPTPVGPQPSAVAEEPSAAAHPVPLGAGVLAYVPTVTPTQQAADGDQ
jgi:hypothetical protein